MIWLYKTDIWWKSKILLHVYIWHKYIADESKTRYDTSNYELDHGTIKRTGITC